MTLSRDELLVELRKALAETPATGSEFYDDRRSVPCSTEAHVTAALRFVTDLYPEGETAAQDRIAFLADFERFGTGRILDQVVAINATSVELEAMGDLAGALNAAERVLSLFAEDVYNHYLISRFHDAMKARDADFVPLEDYLKSSFCDIPFRHFETVYSGDVFLCCPSWVPLPAGNILKQDPAEIWNSPSARAVRRSILDGDFKYCSRLYCHLIQARTLMPRTVNRSLDWPDREPMPPYRGFSLWNWAGRLLAVEGEPERVDPAALPDPHFRAGKMEEIKVLIDRHRDAEESEADGGAAPSAAAKQREAVIP